MVELFTYDIYCASHLNKELTLKRKNTIVPIYSKNNGQTNNKIEIQLLVSYKKQLLVPYNNKSDLHNS